MHIRFAVLYYYPDSYCFYSRNNFAYVSAKMGRVAVPLSVRLVFSKDIRKIPGTTTKKAL